MARRELDLSPGLGLEVLMRRIIRCAAVGVGLAILAGCACESSQPAPGADFATRKNAALAGPDACDLVEPGLLELVGINAEVADRTETFLAVECEWQALDGGTLTIEIGTRREVAEMLDRPDAELRHVTGAEGAAAFDHALLPGADPGAAFLVITPRGYALIEVGRVPGIRADDLLPTAERLTERIR